ncbi:MAG: porin family protein [Pseudomonadota bacterium]
MRIFAMAALAAFLPGLAAAQSFSGPSVGAQVSFGDVETENPALEGDDLLFGVRAYFDADLGGFLLGGGLQYDTAEIELGDGVVDVEAVFRLGARGGIQSGKNYFYGTGGFAQAYLSEDSIGDSGGYFIGVGYEGFVTDNITAGAEVLFHRFEDFDLEGLEADVVTVGATVNYRF